MTARNPFPSAMVAVMLLIAAIVISGVVSIVRPRLQLPTILEAGVVADVRTRNSSELHMMLVRGANADAREQPADGIGRERTALMIAAGQHDIECIRELLQYHADINMADKYKWTALIFAAGSENDPHVENADSVRLLLDNKADINAATADGVTALIRAASCGSEQTIKLLISRGADVRRRDKRGRTALMLAIKNKRPNIVEALHKAGVQD